MWSVNPNRSVLLKDGATVKGARVVYVDSDGKSFAEEYTRLSTQTAAQFRTALIGAGTIAAPQGGVGATLAALNNGYTEEPIV